MINNSVWWNTPFYLELPFHGTKLPMFHFSEFVASTIRYSNKYFARLVHLFERIGIVNVNSDQWSLKFSRGKATVSWHNKPIETSISHSKGPYSGHSPYLFKIFRFKCPFRNTVTTDMLWYCYLCLTNNEKDSIHDSSHIIFYNNEEFLVSLLK